MALAMNEKGKTLKKFLWAVSMWQGEGTNTEGGLLLQLVEDRSQLWTSL